MGRSARGAIACWKSWSRAGPVQAPLTGVGVDQPGVEGGQIVVFQAELGSGVGREVAYQDIGPSRQPLECGPGAGDFRLSSMLRLLRLSSCQG